MKKYLVLIFSLFLFCLRAEALDIVYPKVNPVKINANSTFFIGSANPKKCLKINDIEVPVSSQGAFAQVVPLSIGLNNFKLISGPDVIDFVIERPQLKSVYMVKPILIEYPIMTFYVKNDNVPLRITPVSSGINRMSHLPIDTRLSINGEKGNFYRVYLNPTLSAWVAKSDVEQRKAQNVCESQNNLVVINEFKMSEDKSFYKYEFDLTAQVPFAIKEEDGLTLQLFNINDVENNTYSLRVPTLKLIGYEAFYEKNKFILKVRKPITTNQEKPLNSIVIAVDAGHGGKEFGAIGCCGEKEKDINLTIAKNLQQELEQRGAKVVMTRKDDVTLALQDRVKIAKDNDAMFSISIHSNALPDGQDPIKNRGTSVYYYHNQAKSLAENILNSMTAELCIQNDKVRQGSLALVRPTSSVSVLVEVAYMINPDDYALLTDKCFQQKCAKAIADGVENYMKDNTNVVEKECPNNLGWSSRLFVKFCKAKVKI